MARLGAVWLLFVVALTASAKDIRSGKILLSNVKTLTLRDGQYTSHRRVDPMPQLSCIGGNAAGIYTIDTMQCRNSGSEYGSEDVQWTCQASLPPEFKLGSTDVVCEGYDHPDDPYILKGSCGVEYRLILTPAGEEKYGRNSFERVYKKPNAHNLVEAFWTLVFWAIFLAVIGTFIYAICIKPNDRGNNDRRPNRNNWQNFGGGWGNDDGGDDPPPPYSPQPPRSPRPKKPSTQSNTYRSSQSADPNSWRPGFWTGAAAGAAAGYAANSFANRSQNRAPQMQQQQPVAGPSNWFTQTQQQPQPPQPQPSGSWFGGGGGGGGGSRSIGRSSNSGSMPAPSSSRYESTGFGGTRRR